jgi:phytoene synthase
MEFQVERARQYYAKAFAQLPEADRRSQVAGLIMAAIYRTTLEEIVKDGCRVLTHRLSLPPLRKLWLAARTWITA